MIDIKRYIVYNLAMFNKYIKAKSLVLFLMIVFMLASCFKMPQEEETKIPLPTETPPLPAPQTQITMMLKTDDFVMEDWAVMDELFKRSGISAVIKTIRPARFTETLKLNLSSGEIYDIMELPPEYAQAADQYIIDAAPLINQYAPNYVNWINTFSSNMLTSLATTMGEVKVFPIRQESGVIGAVPFIKNHVEGREFDASSFYNAVFQSGGRFAVPGSTVKLCELMAPFFNTSSGVYLKDGVETYGPVTEEFKAMLLYLNSMYQNNLLSESFFVYTATNLLFDMTSGDVTAGIITEKYYEQAYEAGMEPFMFKPVDGAHLLGYTKEPVSYAAITSANGMEVQAMQFIDYCFSDEGRELLNNGIEGLHIRKFDNGVMEPLKPYTRYDAYQWKEQGLTPEGMPGVYYNSWMKFSPELYDLLVPMRQYAPDESTEAFWLPVTGNEAIASQVVLGELNPLLHEWWSEFIVGSKSLSSDWHRYVNDINGTGLNIYINIHYK